jgi:hypothetical protein
MKKLTFSLLFIALFINISLAQIPNFSFENWTNMGAYDNPDQWGTLNNTTDAASVYTAEKGGPGNPGSFYLKLTTKKVNNIPINGIAVSGKFDSINKKPVSGFAYNLRPQKFTGKWQHMVSATSPGGITATLTKWNGNNNKRDTIAIANQTLGFMVMSWSGFSIPFVYMSGDNPDSCIIFLRASGSAPTNQDYLYVDSLAFQGTVTGVENNVKVHNEFSVFPNPAYDNIVLKMNEITEQPVILEIRDMNGKLMLTKDLGRLNGPTKETIDLSGLASASYLINILLGDEKRTQKIVIQ